MPIQGRINNKFNLHKVRMVVNKGKKCWWIIISKVQATTFETNTTGTQQHSLPQTRVSLLKWALVFLVQLQSLLHLKIFLTKLSNKFHLIWLLKLTLSIIKEYLLSRGIALRNLIPIPKIALLVLVPVGMQPSSLISQMNLHRLYRPHFNNNNYNCNNNRMLSKSLLSIRPHWMSTSNLWRSKSKCSNSCQLISSIWCWMHFSSQTQMQLKKFSNSRLINKFKRRCPRLFQKFQVQELNPSQYLNQFKLNLSSLMHLNKPTSSFSK